MDISSQISIAVYCAENWKMLVARIHLFPAYVQEKKIDKRWSSSDAGRLSIV